MSDKIQWLNALSTKPSLEEAVAEVADTIKTQLTTTPDLGIVFASVMHATDYPRLMPLLQKQLPIPCVIGCGAAGVIGMKNPHQPVEVEGKYGLSLTVASLKGAKITPFHILSENLPDLDSPPFAWYDLIGVDAQENPHFILLAESFFASRINELLEGLDYAYPKTVKIGGLASTSALFYYDGSNSKRQLLTRGAIGVAISGVAVDAIVAQGCRPVGDIYQVTKAQKNVILEMSDHRGHSDTALNCLRRLIATLSPTEQKLATHSLFIGIAKDEFQVELGAGDFLIRNLIGVDPKHGALALGNRIRPGQRVQFHLRDAKASAEELETLLVNYSYRQASQPVGALMFSCLGRGEGLYKQPNFDSQLFSHYFPDIPLGGFFCNGEIGPLGSSTFLHGYTSVFGIFYPTS